VGLEDHAGRLDRTAFAMVGTTSLFVLDPTALANCKDKAGAATGVPDIAELASEVPHQCNPTTFPVNAVPGECPYKGGVRKSKQFTGTYQYFLKQNPGLHGIALLAGDLPSTLAGGAVGWLAAEKAGLKSDGAFKVSGSDTQAAYGRFVQTIKEKGSTYVGNGSNDVAMIKMRKEANAQGGTPTVKVWSCSAACYTPNFLEAGGKDVEGTYVALGFLPYEDAGSNASLDAYLAAIGGVKKATSWGAAAWAGADEFKLVADQIVAQDGPNALTRAKLIDGLKNLKGFDDNGFFAPRDQGQPPTCFIMMQVQNGKFVRIKPTEKGQFDCNPDYLTPVAVDPTVFKG
jgi:hypothetical protein